MTKIFFDAPLSVWTADGRKRRQWEHFLENIIRHAPSGSVAANAASADIIIHWTAEQTDSSKLRDLIRPLSRNDVEHLVWDWGDKPTGRYSGFYCSLPRGLFKPDRHRSLSYPLDFNELVDLSPQSDAKFNFGFVGGITAGVRHRLVRMFEPRTARDNSLVKVQGADWKTVFVRNGGQLKEDYAEFLRATKFVLCPRGYGVGSARLFETMKAGRVPVIVSDEYVPPHGIDWPSCSLRLRERDIAAIPALIESRLADWPRMARAARAAWENHFSGQHLVRYMLQQAVAMRASARAHNPVRGIGYSARMLQTVVSDHVRPALGLVRQRLRGG